MSSHADDTPTFNLKAVVQETGLKPDTLRAWERRYGLPTPERSQGRHRLYSQRDIDILKWLNARQDEGLTISRAVDLWRKLEVDGKDPLEELMGAETTGFPAPVMGPALVELKQAWVNACLLFDEAQAEHVLSQAFALYTPETVLLEVMRRGLVHIGEEWHAGNVSAQQEHFASELSMRRLEVMIGATNPTRTGRILIACPPDESHTFSPLLINFLLRRQGWRTIFLGANVPLTRFEATLAQARPNLIVFSAQQLHTAATLADLADAVSPMRIPVGFGGLIFTLMPNLTKRIAGHYLGDSIDHVAPAVERLLASPPPLPAPVLLPAGYAAAMEHYLDKRSILGARVWDLLQDMSATLHPLYFSIANTYLAQNIYAALRLGSMDFLSADMAWIEGLLYERQIPRQALVAYMQAYTQAATEVLDARGEPIVDWLRNLVASSNRRSH